MLVLDNVAALGNIPWSAIVDPFGVDRVGRGLYVNTIRPKTCESDVKKERHERYEDVEQPHGRLDQPEERAYYADDEVVLGVETAPD